MLPTQPSGAWSKTTRDPRDPYPPGMLRDQIVMEPTVLDYEGDRQ